MHYDFEELMKFKKADAQIRIIINIGNIIKIENLSLKKANSDSDYNQVDKRWVNSYKDMWKFDDDIAFGLKLFTGEINPYSCHEIIKNKTLEDKRRMFLDELPENLRNKINLQRHINFKSFCLGKSFLPVRDIRNMVMMSVVFDNFYGSFQSQRI